MPDFLLSERHGSVCVLTLNRPSRRNALSVELITAVRHGIQKALVDDAVVGTVITGAPPAFSAGLDLELLLAGRSDSVPLQNALHELHSLYTAILASKKPIVAAVNGAAVAGGAGLALACDVSVAAQTARIGYPGIKHGVVAAIVVPPLIRCVGEKRAKFLLLTGELLSADQAMNAGLINEAVHDSDCLARAIHWAERLASIPADAYAHTKRLIAGVQRLNAITDTPESHMHIQLSDTSLDAIEKFLANE